MASTKFLIGTVAIMLLSICDAYNPTTRSISHSRILPGPDDLLSEYDYVVIGGGTSGLTVADRLTENGKREFRTPVRTRRW